MKTDEYIKFDLKYKYKQTYRKVWEQIPEFKGWLRPAPDKQPNKAYCCYCNKVLHAHRISLLKHTCTAVHQRATQQILHGPLPPEDRSGGQMEIVSKVCKIASLDGNETDKTFQEIVDGDNCDNATYYVHYQEADCSVAPDAEAEAKEKSDEETEKSEEFITVEQNNTLDMSSSPVTTHVLDTSIGRPVGNLLVTFAKYDNSTNNWNVITENRTDDNGRLGSFIQKAHFTEGCYRLQFHVNEYFEKNGINSFYPLIEIVFNAANPNEHYHVPVLLSPYGYSTYRGS